MRSAPAIFLELDQGTPEWHAWRHHGIGGSDAPAVIGVSPYRTARELFREKSRAEPRRNAGTNTGKAYIFALGHSTEAKCRALLEQKLGAAFPPACVQHPRRDFQRASLDGFNAGLGIFEAKYMSPTTLSSILRKGALPEHHYVQVQHSLAVTGLDLCFYMAMDGRGAGALVEVRANLGYIEKLEAEECRFWEMVLKNRKAGEPIAFFRNRLPDESDSGIRVLHTLRNAAFAAQPPI